MIVHQQSKMCTAGVGGDWYDQMNANMIRWNNNNACVTDECAVWCLICGGYGLSWTSQRVFTGEESATISYVHSHRSICLVSEAAGTFKDVYLCLLECRWWWRWGHQSEWMEVADWVRVAVLMTHSTWVDVMNAALAQIRAQNLWNT